MKGSKSSLSAPFVIWKNLIHRRSDKSSLEDAPVSVEDRKEDFPIGKYGEEGRQNSAAIHRQKVQTPSLSMWGRAPTFLQHHTNMAKLKTRARQLAEQYEEKPQHGNVAGLG